MNGIWIGYCFILTVLSVRVHWFFFYTPTERNDSSSLLIRPFLSNDSQLHYPLFRIPQNTSQPMDLVVWPMRVLSTFSVPMIQPVKENGVVFHVYSRDRCRSKNNYMKQVEYNAQFIKKKDPTANIALITNCNVPLSTAQYLSVIVPVAPEDVLDTSEKQWLTRVLYNAYLPFHYSYILDTHIFSLFKESDVDVSASCRVGGVVLVSGGAVLSKWGEASHAYWKSVYKWMLERMWFDDQRPMLIYSKNTSFWKYQWLSSNWIWASHGISETGIFSGPSKCYRSSVIVTGPVMWIHGGPGECTIMNGQNNSVAFKKRVFFRSGECEMKKNGPMVVFTKEQLDELVAPQKPPLLNWNITRDSTSLFWEY